MGVDIAELLLEVEERYAIELGEDEIGNIRTFGDLVDSIKRTIDKPLDPPIEESRNEIILQSLLAELRARLPRDAEINEETKLKQLRPLVKQHDIWSLVQQRFPELPTWHSVNFRRTFYLDRPTFLSFLGVMVAWLVIGTVSKYFGESLWTFFVAAVPCLLIAFAWLFWTVERLPHRTVGDVAHAIAERRQKLLKAREYSSADIENELRIFMSKRFALKPEEIQRESDLVKDLGLG